MNTSLWKFSFEDVGRKSFMCNPGDVMRVGMLQHYRFQLHATFWAQELSMDMTCVKSSIGLWCS
jgi:hypothetical protein